MRRFHSMPRRGFGHTRKGPGMARRWGRAGGRGFYRSRHGMILGVVRGIAEYFDFSVFWARAIAVCLVFFTGFWPVVGLYLLAALLMKPEPVVAIATEDQHEFYDSYVHSRKGAVDRLKRRYDNLDRRIQRMEHVVTRKEFDWEHRLNNA